MKTEQLINKGVKKHFTGKVVLFDVISLEEHYDGLLIHKSDITYLEEGDLVNGYVKAEDVNMDNAVAKEVALIQEEVVASEITKIMEPEGMTFEEAEKLAQTGELITLPEWEGFWFVDIKTGLMSVLTKYNEILDTPFEEFKTRNDWKTVEASPIQASFLEKHYQKLVENSIIGTGLVDEVTTDSVKEVKKETTSAPSTKSKK